MKQDPHPFVSCGTVGFPDMDVSVPKHVEKRVEAIFEEYAPSSPHETNRTHTMGGVGHGSDDQKHRSIRWLPQNKRFYFAFSRFGFSPDRLNTHTRSKKQSMGCFFEHWNPDYSVTSMNSGAEWKVEGFYGCDLRVKKTQIEILPHVLLNVEREFVCLHHEDAKNWLQGQMHEMRVFVEKVLFEFTRAHGGSVGEFLKVTKGDDGIFGDSFIDSLAPDVRFTNPEVKKVYPHKTEFRGHDFAGAYLSNSALRSVVPEVEEVMRLIADRISWLPDAIKARSEPWDVMFAHADEWNGLDSDGQARFLQEVFGL